jgi:hypothetical protein
MPEESSRAAKHLACVDPDDDGRASRCPSRRHELRPAPFSITGTIVEFRFINPHLQITLDVTDGDGKITKWVAQGTSPNMLVYRGWSATVLKPDVLSPMFAPCAMMGPPTIEPRICPANAPS